MFPFPLPLLSFPSRLGFLSFPLVPHTASKNLATTEISPGGLLKLQNQNLQYCTIWSTETCSFSALPPIPTHPPSLTSSHSGSLLCIFLCDLNPAATQTCSSLSGTHPVLINKTKNNKSYIRPHLQKALLMPPTQGLRGTVCMRYMWAPGVRGSSMTGS